MKKYILPLLIASMLSFVKRTNASSNETTTKADSILPPLNNDLAFNLCYNSLLYWRREASRQDSVLMQERKKIAIYEKVFGIQSNTEQDLLRVKEIREEQTAQCRDENLSLSSQLKKSKRGNTMLKIGMFVLPPAAFVGGFLIANKLK